ncbi:MAG: YbjQ family protein, partial [Thermoguttaceae bacterium]
SFVIRISTFIYYTSFFYREIIMHFAVTTTFDIDGYKIVDYKGVVRGIIVRAPTIAQGIFGGLKSIIGGQIGAYTEMCEQTRRQAYELMIQHAQEMGANAVVGLRYDASEVASKVSATEVLCYGTAVVIEPIA